MKKVVLLFFLIALFLISYSIMKKDFKASSSNHPAGKPLEESMGSKDNPEAAQEFYTQMLSIKGKNISLTQAIRNAINYSKRNIKLYKPAGLTTAPQWSTLGPSNIGGRIRAIVVNKNNSNQILLGAVDGGIWKTTDGGTSWTPMTDSYGPIPIGCFAYDSNNTVYAGTGEGWGNLDAVVGGGIFKSTDFGSTWSLLPSTYSLTNSSTDQLYWEFKNVLALDIDSSGNIYAATKAIDYNGGIGSYYTYGGIYKSTDNGNSWNKISPTAFSTDYFNPSGVVAFSSSTTIFASGPNGTTLGGIYRTTDDGSTWNAVTSGLPSTGYNTIVLTKDNSGNAYAVYQSTDNSTSGAGGLKGIFKSTNSGASWSQLTSPQKIKSAGNISYLGTQGWYGSAIAVDPFNHNNIYVGGIDMMKSANGGSSWNQISYWDPYYGTPVAHADHHIIAFDPNNSGVLYSGNDGGIYKSSDGGSSWTALNNNLSITQFYSGAVYNTGTTYSGGTQDNGHLKFSSGTTWNMVETGDGGYTAQSQSDSLTFYEEYTYLQMSKTSNGGGIWANCTSGLSDAGIDTANLFIAPFAINPENSNVLIAGSNKVWITGNGAASWVKSSNTFSQGDLVSAVTVVNSSANFLGFAGLTNGHIFKCTSLSTSGLSSWTDITPPNQNGAWVRRIVVDLNNKNHIYACYSGFNGNATAAVPGEHIWYSSDQGSTWTDISASLPDVPVHTLVIDPINNQTLYVGTETGIFNSTDNGSTWNQYNTGMPPYVAVDELVLQSGTSTLFAFTHGRSVWINNTPLPVELVSFAGYSIQSAVELDWNTATEINNYGFEVQRAVNNSSDINSLKFETVKFIPGAGTSTQMHQYTFVDNNINNLKYAYRLKQIDIDGQTQFSKIIFVDATSAISKYDLSQNYPNPFNPTTNIKYSVPVNNKRVLLKIYDIKGSEVSTLVNKIEPSGNYEVQFNAGKLASGVYFYRLSTGNFTLTKKMLLLK